MTKRILILKGAKALEDSEASELTQLLSGHIESKIDLISYFDLVFVISDKEQEILTPSGESIADYDAIYLRDFQNCEYERNACAMLLRARGVPFLNSDTATFQHISKLTQYFALSMAQVPIPSSIFGPLTVVEDRVVAEYGFPFIAKSITGKNGGDNFLIRNWKHLEEKRSSIESDKFIFQEYVENDCDFRVVVIGDVVGEIYERKRPADGDNHVNNAAAGGVVQVSQDHNDKVEQYAISAAKAIGRELTGVDVMTSLDGSRTLVLEVNANYAIKGFMNEDSADIKLLAEYLDNASGATQ